MDEQEKLIERLAHSLRAPLHRPVDDDDMPCEQQARFLAELIDKVSRRHNGVYWQLDFGGAGDDGEFLVGILDVLIEAGLVQVNTCPPTKINSSYLATLRERLLDCYNDPDNESSLLRDLARDYLETSGYQFRSNAGYAALVAMLLDRCLRLTWAIIAQESE